MSLVLILGFGYLSGVLSTLLILGLCAASRRGDRLMETEQRRSLTSIEI